MFRKLLAALAVAASVFTAPAFAADELNFGIISTESSVNLKKIWEPFLADMAKQTGLKINPFFASEYAGVIEGMKFGKVQVAWFGNKSAMEAVDRSNGEIFAQTVAADGSPGYWSLMITHKDSPLNTLEDMLKCDGTLNFGIGDTNSTSGFLVPTSYVFAARNIDYKKCFKTVVHASHEVNAMAAANKQVHVATNNTESMDRLKKTNPEAYANLKEIWRSPLIPSDPLVWRADLDDAAKAKVKDFILGYGVKGSDEEKAAALAILKELGWAPFRESSNAQLYPIRILEANKKINKANGDEKLSAEEKAKIVAEQQAVIKDVEAKMAAAK